MATRTWSGSTNSDMNNSANYSGAGALLTSDDLVFNSGSVASTSSADLSVNSVTTTSGYSGSWSISGHGLTVAQGAAWDHVGTLNLGNSVTSNGASATVHLGSGVSSITASSCTLTMNGTTGMTLQDNYGVTFKAFVLGANAIVTNSGSSPTSCSSSSTPLTFTNGGTLTANTIMAFKLSGTANILSVLAGSPTFNGSAVIFFDHTGSSTTMSIPAFTYSGTNTVIIRSTSSSGTPIVSLLGDVVIASFIIEQISTGPLTFNTNNHNITVSIGFSIGNSSSPAATFNFGSSSISCTAFTNFSLTGPANVNLQSSQWFFAASLSHSAFWTPYSGWAFSAGTSTLTFTGTGNATVTTAGFPLYNIVVNSASLVFTFADTPSIHSLTVTQAITYTHTGLVLTASSNVTFNGTGTYNFGNGITMTGPSAILLIGANIQYPSSSSCVLTMNGTTGMTIQDNFGVTFNALILGPNAVITNSGSSSSVYSTTSTPALVFTSGGTLTLNTIISFRVSGNTDVFTTLAGSPTVNGTNILFFDNIGTSNTMTIPAFTYSGSNNLIIRGLASGVGSNNISLTGTLNATSLLIEQSSTVALTFSTNNNTITTSSFSIGNSSTSVSTFNFGSSTINCLALSYFTLTGPANVNLGSSHWIMTSTIIHSTVWTNFSGWTLNPGTSTITFLGTGNATITSSGLSLYNIIVNSPNLTFYLADNASVHDYSITDVSFYSHADVLLTSSGNVTFGGTTSASIGNGITMTGANTTLMFASTMTINKTASDITFTGNNITLHDDYGVTVQSFTLADNLSGTFASSISQHIIKLSGPNTIITLGQNSHFHQNVRLFLTSTGSCTLFSFGVGSTWISSFNTSFFNNSGSTVYLPTVPYVGDGNGRWLITSSVNTTCTTLFTGGWDFYPTIIDLYSEMDGPLIHTIDFNDNDFTFDNLKVGNTGGFLNNNVTVNYGNGTFSIRTFNITSDDDGIDFSGPCTHNFQSATFIVGGEGQFEFQWYFAPEHVVNPGTFTIQGVAVDANPLNLFSFTSNGHSFYDIVTDYGGRNFAAVGDMHCHNLTVTNGIWSNNGYTVTASGNVTFSGLDTFDLGNGLILTGSSTLLIDTRVGQVTSPNPITFTGNGAFLTVNSNSVILSSIIVGPNASLTANGVGNPFNITGTGTLLSLGNNSTTNWNQITYLNPADSITTPIFFGTGAVLNGQSNLILSTIFLDRLILGPGQQHSFRTDVTTTLTTYLPGDWAGVISNPVILNSDTSGRQAALIIPGGISFTGTAVSDIAFTSTQDATATVSSFKNISTNNFTLHTDLDSTNLGTNFGIDFPSVNYFSSAPYITYPPAVHYNQAPYINGVAYTSTLDMSTLIGLTGFDPYFDDQRKFRRVDVVYSNGRERKIVTHIDGTGQATWSLNALNGSWKKVNIKCSDYDGALLDLTPAQIRSSQDLFLVSAPTPYIAPIFYVDGLNGNDGNTGLSLDQAFKTLQKGADVAMPGSTVYVVDSTTYVSNRDTTSDPHTYPLHINNPGLPGYYINYKAYSGRPKIYNDFNWSGIKVDGSAAYISIEGFEVIGNAPAIDYTYAIAHKEDLDNYRTSHAGISVQRAFPGDGTNFPHHVIIKNNICHDNAGSGIGAGDADYISIIGNISYNNANWSPYAESGITFGFSTNIDKNSGYHHYVIGNYCYNNLELVPFYAVGYISDGNGIIVDSLNTPQNSHGSFIGRTLIANNICFNNGGRGLNVFASNNIDVINNTTYHNGRSGVGISQDGIESNVDSEASVNQSSGTFFYNNIFYSRPDRTVVDFFAPDATFNYNVYNSDAPFRGYPNPFVPGPNDQSGLNFFVNASTDPTVADFHTTGIGHNDGTTFLAVTTDFNGAPRPIGSYDRGAYES